MMAMCRGIPGPTSLSFAGLTRRLYQNHRYAPGVRSAGQICDIRQHCWQPGAGESHGFGWTGDMTLSFSPEILLSWTGLADLPRASAVGRIACSHSQASAKDRDFQGKGGKMRDRQTDMDHAYRVLHAIVDTCQFQSSPLNSWDLDAHAHIRHKSVLPASVIAERNVLPFPSGSASSGRDLWLTMPPEKIAKRRS